MSHVHFFFVSEEPYDISRKKESKTNKEMRRFVSVGLRPSVAMRASSHAAHPPKAAAKPVAAATPQGPTQSDNKGYITMGAIVGTAVLAGAYALVWEPYRSKPSTKQ